MGECGRSQPARDALKWAHCERTGECDPRLYESHGLCPYFYNSAFRNDFVANNTFYKCSSEREPKEIPRGFKMGYLETRKS